MDVLSDRIRIKWVIKQLRGLPATETILDAGAGEQRYKKYCAHLKYISQDFGVYIPGEAGVGLHPKLWNAAGVDIVSDITKIPVKSGSFDNILCTEVLEHIPYPDLAIKELSRILKKGGRLILTAPFCAQTHFAPFFFCTGFSVYWYRRTLIKYNLKILKLYPNGNFFDYLVQELLRLPLVAKKYSFLGPVGLLLYFLVIPIVPVLFLVSKLSKKSENQLCFGWHVIARKI